MVIQRQKQAAEQRDKTRKMADTLKGKGIGMLDQLDMKGAAKTIRAISKSPLKSQLQAQLGKDPMSMLNQIHGTKTPTTQ